MWTILRTTVCRREIIQQKPFLKRIYEDWYRAIALTLPEGHAPVLGLGSGAGFMREHIPRVFASDVLAVPHVDLIADAAPICLWIAAGHCDDECPPPSSERARVLLRSRTLSQTGGAIVMVEPWGDRWSIAIYRHLHAEPFEPQASDWTLPSSGPLSGPKWRLALDRVRAWRLFEQEFPVWRIDSIGPIMPFRYLVSGGISMRALAPASTYSLWEILERRMSRWAMFARIVLIRTPASS